MAWQSITLEWDLTDRPFEARKWLLITGGPIRVAQQRVIATYTPDELARLVRQLQALEPARRSLRAMIQGGHHGE